MKEIYKKPTITIGESERAIFPAVATIAGVMAALKKGKLVIDSTHTQSINRRVRSKEI